jgi:putative heme-binding domain-containing protein
MAMLDHGTTSDELEELLHAWDGEELLVRLDRPTGAWIVSYWHIRMPHIDVTPADQRWFGGAKMGMPEMRRIASFLEEGGRVDIADGANAMIPTALVTGRIFDSTTASGLPSVSMAQYVIGAILDPQKEIKEGYTSLSVTTKDGEEYQGYQVRETSDELVLRDLLQNKEIRLRRDNIKTKNPNGSLMPAGLADPLTRAEFRDLVRFLSELGKPR